MHRCPFCSIEHNVSIGFSGARFNSQAPTPDSDGFIALCISCGEWAIFDAAAPGGLRKPTEAEQQAMAAMPGLHVAREAWMRARQ